MFGKRRSFQVSLRTVLVLATAMCVAVGIGQRYYYVRQADEGVEELQRLGAVVAYRRIPAHDVPEAIWMRHLLGEHILDEVEAVALSHPKPSFFARKGLPVASSSTSNRVVTLLDRMSSVTYLNLTGIQLTDQDLAALSRHQNLTSLTITGRSFSPAGIKSLKGCGKLRSLTVRCENISYETLRALAEINSLRELVLLDCPLDAPRAAALEHCDHLLFLRLVHEGRPTLEENKLEGALLQTVVTFSYGRFRNGYVRKAEKTKPPAFTNPVARNTISDFLRER